MTIRQSRGVVLQRCVWDVLLRDTWPGGEDCGSKESVRNGIFGQCARDMLERRRSPVWETCLLPVLVEIISEGGDSAGKASVRPVTAVTAFRSYTRQIQRILF